MMQGALGGYPQNNPRRSYRRVPGYTYEHPYEQPYGQYYDLHKQVYGRPMGMGVNVGGPVELSSTQVLVEAPAEPMSPKNKQ